MFQHVSTCFKHSEFSSLTTWTAPLAKTSANTPAIAALSWAKTMKGFENTGHGHPGILKYFIPHWPWPDSVPCIHIWLRFMGYVQLWISGQSLRYNIIPFSASLLKEFAPFDSLGHGSLQGRKRSQSNCTDLEELSEAAGAFQQRNSRESQESNLTKLWFLWIFSENSASLAARCTRSQSAGSASNASGEVHGTLYTGHPWSILWSPLTYQKNGKRKSGHIVAFNWPMISRWLFGDLL